MIGRMGTRTAVLLVLALFLPAAGFSQGPGAFETQEIYSSTGKVSVYGQVQLRNNADKVCWRNAANTADICIYLDSSDVLQLPAVNVTGSLTVGGVPLAIYPGAGIPVSTGFAWGASLTAPSGAIVGTIDTQTLSNKTLASPVINTSATGSALQGTDSKLLTAGAVSGTGSPLCTDTSGGATTSGCSSGLSVISKSQSNLATTSTGTQLVTVATPGTDQFYLVSVEVEGTAAASGCSSNPVVTADVIFTNAANNATAVQVSGNYAVLSLNAIQLTVGAYVKSGTNLQAGINVSTAGSGCSTNAIVATQIRALPE